MDWTSIVTTVLSVVVGGLITAYFSRRYYVKASADLTKEADNLRRLTIMLMRLLDQAGVIPVKWDENGNPLMTVTVTTPPISTLFRRTEPRKGTPDEETGRG